jgi:hypothetical protein
MTAGKAVPAPGRRNAKLANDEGELKTTEVRIMSSKPSPVISPAPEIVTPARSPVRTKA